MRRPSFAILFSLLSAVLLMASPARGADHGALFRVSQGTHVMYLFGTLHVGQPEFYPLEPRITEALAESTTLALELDPDLSREAMLDALRDHGMLAAGGPGYAALAPDQQARLDTLIHQAGLDAGTVLRYQPVLLAIMLTLADTTRLGYRPDWADRAALDAIAARCEADRSVSGRFVNAVLLKERNAALADKLAALLEREDRTVAAIGVMHLLGTGSVPALLTERGMVVEQVY